MSRIPFSAAFVARPTAVAVALAAAMIGAPAAFADGGRVYEQVSPVTKNGYDAFPSVSSGPAFALEFPVIAASSGDRILFGANGPFAGAAFGNQNAYLAGRNGDGWQTNAISPPQLTSHPVVQVDRPTSLEATPDLSRVAFATDYGGVTPNTPNQSELSVRGDDGQLMLASQGSLGGTADTRAYFGGMSENGEHVLFMSTRALEPDAAVLDPAEETSSQNIYDRDLSTGTTRLVNRLPDGSVTSRVRTGHAAAVNVTSSLALTNYYVPGAISADGSRIVFTTSPITLTRARRVMLRVDGARTLEVSLPQTATPGTAGPAGALFQKMTPDGKHVFFVADRKLTDDAPATGASLYRFDVNADGTGGDLKFISGGMAKNGLVGSSDDGAVAYFTSVDAIGGQGQAGLSNLYVSDHGAISFIGTVDAAEPILSARYSPTGSGTISLVSGDNQSRVSPDGRHLLFRSTNDLTDYSSGGAGQVYSYTLGEDLDCVSCGAPGTTGNARLTNTDATVLAAPPRNLSSDGRRIFFETDRGLVPTDQNHRYDVYEVYDGQLSLVSRGDGSSDSYFAGASEDGRDAFILSYQQLAASDRDTLGDIYDARLGGGFPLADGGVSGPAPCGGDDCRPGASAQPNVLGAGSETVVGPGNLTPVETPKAAPKLQITKRKVSGHTVVLSVRAPGKGRITTSGTGTKSIKRSTSRGTVYSVRVPLNKPGLQRLRAAKQRKASFAIRVSFKPAQGRSSSVTTKITVKR